MTAMAYDPQPPEAGLLEGFLALETPEGYRAELIDGEIFVTTPPRGDHEELIAMFTFQACRKSAIEIHLSQNKGLTLPGVIEGLPDYVIPDITLAPAEQRPFHGAGPWMPCDGVLLVAEVTSTNPTRDRVAKRRSYALGGIPYYLLIDRNRKRVTLFSGPVGDDYQEETWVPFGKPIAIPEPLAFELDTSRFY